VEVFAMRRTLLTAISAVVLLGSAAAAQDLLDKLEKKIGGPAAAPAAPAHGYLGLTPDEDYKLNDGVRVLDVKPGGPADTAGVMKGDLVKSVDGKRVQTVDEMDNLQKTTTPGQIWQLMVDRAGRLQTLKVKLGTRPTAAAGSVTDNPGEAPPTLIPPSLVPPPAAPPATSPPTTSPPTTAPAAAPPAAATESSATPPAATDPSPAASAPIRSRPLDPFAPPTASPPAAEPPASTPADPLLSPAAPPATSGGASLGITVVPLSDEARLAYGLGVRRGALITNVRPGSPADTAGLPIGAVVTMVDGQRIDTADELVAFIRAARPGQEIELGYMQGDRQQRKTVRLGPTATSAAPGGVGSVLSGSGASGGAAPLLNRVERMVDRFAPPPRGGSTVYDPGEMADLKARVMELSDQVKALKERLDAMEGRPGGAPPTPGPGLGGFTPMP
jgi:hypothetical protein